MGHDGIIESSLLPPPSFPCSRDEAQVGVGHAREG